MAAAVSVGAKRKESEVTKEGEGQVEGGIHVVVDPFVLYEAIRTEEELLALLHVPDHVAAQFGRFKWLAALRALYAWCKAVNPHHAPTVRTPCVSPYFLLETMSTNL